MKSSVLFGESVYKFLIFPLVFIDGMFTFFSQGILEIKKDGEAGYLRMTEIQRNGVWVPRGSPWCGCGRMLCFLSEVV